MDRFSPTRKVSKKTGPPFEVDHFSWSDRSEFWLNGSHCLISRWGPDLFDYTSSSVAFFLKQWKKSTFIHLRVTKDLFTNFFMTWAHKEFAYLLQNSIGDSHNPRGCAKILEILEGTGGTFWGLILEHLEGREGHTANPFCGGSYYMDIFWNHLHVVCRQCIGELCRQVDYQ